MVCQPVTKIAVLALSVGVAVCGTGAGLAARPPSSTGSWVGTLTLGGSTEFGVAIEGRRATVALGVGHAGAQTVALSARGTAVQFELPGRPGSLFFALRVEAGALVGTVSQGRARGSVSARRGPFPSLLARGLYAGGGETVAVVDDPYGPARLVGLGTGAVHAVYPQGGAFRIGAGFATREPAVGSARFDATGAVLSGARKARVRVRELEVRFPSAGATLSGTLTLPAGPGRHPAVAWVHGSGPTTRAYLPDLQALLLRYGVGVLAYDKRGVGQSGGRYPGESPTAAAIAVLARDAAAAVRFLAAQPEIDSKRVGLAGHSQAGWIMPLAATREPAVRFLLAFAGPAVTADETDLYQTLTGQGETRQRLSDVDVDAQLVARGPGGIDPLPWIRQLRVPAAWFYGELDKHIPTRLSIRRLEPVASESGRDVTIEVLPRANHALVETQTGLTAEMLRSGAYAPGLFARVGDWLRAHGLS
jgi:uncharacterized protein